MKLELNIEINDERKISKAKLTEIKSKLIDLEKCDEFITIKINLKNYRQEIAEMVRMKDRSIQKMNDELQRIDFLYDNFVDQQVNKSF